MGLIVYIDFPGTAKDAIQYYHKVFGGEYPDIMTFDQVPSDGSEKEYTEEEKKLVMHAEMRIFGDIVMMSDLIGEARTKYQQGNDMSILISTPDQRELERTFHLLKEEAKEVHTELTPTFYSNCYGSLKDKWGVTWQFYTPKVEEK